MRTGRRTTSTGLSATVWLVLGIALTVGAPAPALSQAREAEHWVVSWATAQELYRAPAVTQPTQPATTRPEGQGFRISRTFNNQTVRMVVRPSLGGSRLRIRLANAFGAPTVTIGSAAIAERSERASVVGSSSRSITFAGNRSVTLAPGTIVLSDPVDMPVDPT